MCPYNPSPPIPVVSLSLPFITFFSRSAQPLPSTSPYTPSAPTRHAPGLLSRLARTKNDYVISFSHRSCFLFSEFRAARSVSASSFKRPNEAATSYVATSAGSSKQINNSRWSGPVETNSCRTFQDAWRCTYKSLAVFICRRGKIPLAEKDTCIQQGKMPSFAAARSKYIDAGEQLTTSVAYAHSYTNLL